MRRPDSLLPLGDPAPIPPPTAYVTADESAATTQLERAGVCRTVLLKGALG